MKKDGKEQRPLDNDNDIVAHGVIAMKLQEDVIEKKKYQ